MKKILTLLAMMLALANININATVTIEKPDFTKFADTTLVSGKNYYILNLDYVQFLNTRDDKVYTGLQNEQFPITVELSSGIYMLKMPNGYYVSATSTDGTLRDDYSNDGSDSHNYYNIVRDSSAILKIQLAESNPYYNQGRDKFVGYYVPWGRLCFDRNTLDQWLFIPQKSDNDSIYIANCIKNVRKVSLYDAIAAADTCAWMKNHISYYESIYNDETKTANDILSATTNLETLITQIPLLRTAIENAEAEGFSMGQYWKIYNDVTKTGDEIKRAIQEVNGMKSYTENYSYLIPDWNDYKIGIYSSDFSRSDYGNYLRNPFESYTKGASKSITATANVTEPSTFVVTVRTPDSGDATYCPMSLDIYVDDSLAYNFDGEMYYDCYWEYMGYDYPENYYYIIQNDYNWSNSQTGCPRHFVDLPVGEHKIVVKFTNNDQIGSYRYAEIFTIGIEKTPTISVHNKTVGRVKDEILKALYNLNQSYDINIRDVRKLKISGVMGDDDWTTLKSLTSLFSLDLSETNITTIPDQFFSRYKNPDYTSFLNQMKLPKGLKTIGYESFFASYIKDLDLPDSLETVGRRAFCYSRLHNAIMPNVKTILSYAFMNCYNLKTVVTNKLESLGQRAFLFCHNMDSLQLYGSLKTVPYYAFYDCLETKYVSLSDSIETIQHGAFYRNNALSLNKLPKNLTTINSYAFFENHNVTFPLNDQIKDVGDYTFQSAWYNNALDTLKLAFDGSYGTQAFRYARVKHIDIPENFYSLQQAYLFAGNDSLKSIRLNSPIKVSVASTFVDGLDKSKIYVYVPDYLREEYKGDNYWADFKIRTFKSTEMDSIIIRNNLAVSEDYRFEGTPSVALLEGKTFTLEGAAGMDLKNMTLNNNLNAPSYSQLWTSTDSIKVTGDMIERLYTAANKWYFITLPFDCQLSKLKNESNANYAIRYYDGASRANSNYVIYPESAHNYSDNLTEASTKKTFSYPGASKLTLTFSSSTETESGCDFIYIKDKSGNTTSYNGSIGRKTINLDGDSFDIWMTTDGSQTRYGYSFESIYADGVFLPELKDGINWKNYDCANDTIKAGTGFIFMTSKDSWTEFHSVANGTRNTVFFSADNVNNEQHFALQKNESTNSANAGWNLVGNPYPNYYNCHKISFSAPITLWNGSTYEAKSLRDDDVALKPLQAFFVQCPEDLAEISFPSAGRQLTAEIKDQSNAKAAGNAAGTMAATVPSASPEVNRCLVDISLSDGENSDNTRLVINNSASMSYEKSCDASKFMSMDNTMPQIYTLGADGTKYAINERPFENGTVQLGIYCPVDGTYTLNLTRNNAEHVYIQDSETGSTTEITSDSYSFDAKAGTNTSRLVLAVTSADITGIAEVNADKATVSDASPSVSATDGIYTLDGRKALNTNAPGTYIIRSGSKVKKVIIK